MSTPQAGKVSAVILYPEATQATVPYSASGTPRSIGNSTSVGRAMKVNPSNGIQAAVVAEAPSEIDGNIQPMRHFLTGKTYTGAFEGIVDPQELHYLATGVFGRDVQSVLQAVDTTHTTAAYRHVFKPTRKTVTFTTEEIFGDATYARLTSGVAVSSLRLNFNGGMIGYSANLIGSRQTPNTYPNASDVLTSYDFGSSSAVLPIAMGGNGTITVQRTASPSYPSVAQGNQGNGALAWAGLRYGSQSGFDDAYIQINGTDFTNAKLTASGYVEIVRNLHAQMVGGSGFDQDLLATTEVTTRGQIQLTYETNEVISAMLGHSTLALNIKFKGELIGDSGQYYAMELYLPTCKINSAPLALTNDLMMITVEFDAIYNSSLSGSMSLTLDNTLDVSSLAGQTGSFTGALGGWAAS